jgi:dipeptidyl aminopeptidase/acylaminoacyl peptidase
LDLDRYRPLAVDVDPDVLFIARLNEQGLRELVRLNTLDGTTGPALHTDSKYDFSDAGVRYSGDEKNVISLVYSRQALTQVWLREEDRALQESIDAALPAGHLNIVTSRSRDGSSLIISSSSDRNPGTVYLFKPKAGTLSVVGELAPWLPEKLLSPVQLITFKTRDGLSLDGYVTLPVGYIPGKARPTIILPHGGPWMRDAWGFNPEAQFFASRGYVVFQPNYRGSSGYNAAISMTPRAEFRRMHDDVTDGARTLIKAGIADPAHMAIVGGSFGGYLALCGAAFEPDFYRCAVTIAGVFDWDRVIREAKTYDTESYRHDWLARTLGDPRKERAKFEAMSPFASVGQIRIPVFVAHGEADPIADSSQSHRLVKALAKNGIPYETLFQRDEGHGFYSLKNRVELYERIELFLKKNL